MLQHQLHRLRVCPTIALVAWALAAMACAPSGGAPAESDSGAERPAQAVAAGAMSQGFLRVDSPQNPARPYFHDFGELPFGDTVRWSSTLINDGPEDVTVVGSQAACQCTAVRKMEIFGPDGSSLETRVNFTGKLDAVIPVGGRAVLSIDVVTSASAPNKSKLALVRVETNSMRSTYLTYEVKFIPTLLFEAAPTELRLLTVPTSHGDKTFIKVLRRHRSDVARIIDLVSAPEGVVVEVVENEFGGETHWKVYATVPPLSPIGQLRGKVILRTTDEGGKGDGGRLSIPLVARVVPDLIANPGIYSFGRVPQGHTAPKEVELQALVPGARATVTGHRLEGPGLAEHFAVELRVLPADASHATDRTRVVLRPTGTAPAGALSGTLILELAEPFGGGQGAQLNELHVPIRAYVVEGEA